MPNDFYKFILFFHKVRLVKLNHQNWAKSTYCWSRYLKDYFCYQIIAVAVTEKLREDPLAYKNVRIGIKNKSSRKSKAVSALPRNND